MATVEGTGGKDQAAVLGTNTDTGAGVRGVSNGTAVRGESAGWVGVFGTTNSTTGGAGVWGQSDTAAGVRGISKAAGAGGVEGRSEADDDPGPGVRGKSRGTGVWGESSGWVGVFGKSESSTGGAGVWGENANGVGVYGKGGTAAGRFDGDVEVTGDLRLVGADVAEQFEVAGDVPAGGVVVLDDNARIDICRAPYDRRVAGIVSGLGDRKPAVVLDRSTIGRRVPVAVMGKAWCLADATDRAIGIGDLLTTSGTAGHAMLASEPSRAFGAVIGKALTPLIRGRGAVLVLVGLG